MREINFRKSSGQNGENVWTEKRIGYRAGDKSRTNRMLWFCKKKLYPTFFITCFTHDHAGLLELTTRGRREGRNHDPGNCIGTEPDIVASRGIMNCHLWPKRQADLGDSNIWLSWDDTHNALDHPVPTPALNPASFSQVNWTITSNSEAEKVVLIESAVSDNRSRSFSLESRRHSEWQYGNRARTSEVSYKIIILGFYFPLLLNFLLKDVPIHSS